MAKGRRPLRPSRGGFEPGRAAGAIRSDDRRAALLAALDAHVPMGFGEGLHLAKMRGYAETAPDPFDRHTWSGHFTASALVVSPELDQVLLLHHRALDKWLQCGGHIEPTDPQPGAAALREAREETGLGDVLFHPLWDDLLDVDVHTIPAHRGLPAHDHLDLRYLVTADPAEPLARSLDETKDLRWFDLDAAAKRVDDEGLHRLLAKVRRIRSAIR